MNNKKQNKTTIIAEVGLSHRGSFAKAKKLIKLIALAGADIIKFQTHIAKAESTAQEKFRKGHKFKHKTRYQYWKAHEFSNEQWLSLSKYCEKNNIGFMSSPFSIQSFNVLKKTNQRYWKIGSGEFFSQDLINKVLASKKPIILSTGLSNYKEIGNMIKKLKKNKNKFTILQCTTKYPISLKEVGLNVAHKIKKDYNCKVGLSDHSGKIYPSLYAISNEDFEIIEVHVTTKKKDKSNPDNTSSITLDQLKFLCDYNRNLEIIRSNPVDKNKISKNLNKSKNLFTKSIAPCTDLNKGKRVTLKDICLKKPGTGIDYKYRNKIIGKTLKRDVKSYELLKWSDFEK